MPCICGTVFSMAWYKIVIQCSLVVYHELLKAGSLDDAIREFSLAYPSWAMSHYTMLYEYGKRTHVF